MKPSKKTAPGITGGKDPAIDSWVRAQKVRVRCHGTGLTAVAGPRLYPLCKICKQEVRIGNRNRALSHTVPL